MTSSTTCCKIIYCKNSLKNCAFSTIKLFLIISSYFTIQATNFFAGNAYTWKTTPYQCIQKKSLSCDAEPGKIFLKNNMLIIWSWNQPLKVIDCNQFNKTKILSKFLKIPHKSKQKRSINSTVNYINTTLIDATIDRSETCLFALSNSPLQAHKKILVYNLGKNLLKYQRQPFHVLSFPIKHYKIVPNYECSSLSYKDNNVMLEDIFTQKAKSIPLDLQRSYQGPSTVSPSGKFLARTLVTENRYIIELYGLITQSDHALFLWALDVDTPVGTIAFSPDDSLIFAGTESGEIIILSPLDAHYKRVIHEHNKGILSLTASANNALLISSSYDNTLKIWDLKKQAIIKTFEHPLPIFKVLIDKQNSTLIAAGKKTIYKYSIPYTYYDKSNLKSQRYTNFNSKNNYFCDVDITCYQ